MLSVKQSSLIGASADESRRSPHLRHCPETTLLYRTVERDYPAFLEHIAARGRSLPRYVRQTLPGGVVKRPYLKRP